MFEQTDRDRILQALSPLTNEQWLDVLLKSVQKPAIYDIELPGFPPEAFQRESVGSANEQALREAFSFYNEIKSYAQNLGKALTSESRILDFGCGWGRMIRFFLKDVRADNLYGVDVHPQMIDFCQKLFPYGNFHMCNPLPPLQFSDESIDIVYAYSVFSHLSESAHLRWISEFARVLKPGGILIVTTQGRHFIEFCRSLRGMAPESGWHNSLADSFLDTESCLAGYDSGKFLFSATGGGPALPSSFYGEALIPREYVELEWTEYFAFRDFVDDQRRLPQALIVVQKPDGDLHAWVERLKAIMIAKDVRIKGMQNSISHFESLLSEKEVLLKGREDALKSIYGSRGWKVLTVYYRIRDKILRR